MAIYNLYVKFILCKKPINDTAHNPNILIRRISIAPPEIVPSVSLIFRGMILFLSAQRTFDKKKLAPRSSSFRKPYGKHWPLGPPNEITKASQKGYKKNFFPVY